MTNNDTEGAEGMELECRSSPGPRDMIDNAASEKLLEVSPESRMNDKGDDHGHADDDDASAVNWNWGNDDDVNSISSKSGEPCSANAAEESDDEATVVLNQEDATDDDVTIDGKADPTVVNEAPPLNEASDRSQTTPIKEADDNTTPFLASAASKDTAAESPPPIKDQPQKEDDDKDKDKESLSPIEGSSSTSTSPGVKEQTPQSTVLTPVCKAAQPQPDTDRLIALTDRLFLRGDTDSISVKIIAQALEAELGTTFTKATIRFVKQHLIDLLTEKVQPTAKTVGRDSEEQEQEQDFSESPQQEFKDSKKASVSAKPNAGDDGVQIDGSNENGDNGSDAISNKLSCKEVLPAIGSDTEVNDSKDDDFPNDDEDDRWETQMPQPNADKVKGCLREASGEKAPVANASSGESEDDDSLDKDKEGWETQIHTVVNPSSKNNALDVAEPEANDEDLHDATETHHVDKKVESVCKNPKAMEANDQDHPINPNDTETKTTVPDNNPPTAASGRPTRTAAVKLQPSIDDLIASTDHLFLQADKDSVTVKDIVEALEAEFDLELTKQSRKFVRSHLTGLITGTIESSIQQDEDEDEDQQGEESSSDKEEISEQGDSESEASEYDEEETKSTKKKSSRGVESFKSKKALKTIKSEKNTVKKPNKRAVAKAARLVQVDRLRKQRIEELRVRNEEMQLNQSKEDQERAEKIAAKFETNTEELRVKRLEDRLDLLKRLDQKRIIVIDVDLEDSKKTSGDKSNPEARVKAEPNLTEQDESEEESDSSDDEELEIVGGDKPIKPLPRLHNQNQKSKLALSILGGGPRSTAKQAHANNPLTSPSKSLGARAALRNVLRRKQRQVGNRWLARELGYKDEAEHLKDCMTLAQKKRDIVVKMEQERLKVNELKHQRERLRIQDPGAEQDLDDTQEEATFDESPPVGDPEADDEEDEELELAREIEQEEESVSSELSVSDPAEGENMGESEETDETVVESNKVAEAEAEKSEANISDISSPIPLEAADDCGSFREDEDEPRPFETQPVVKQADEIFPAEHLTNVEGLARVVSTDSSQPTPPSEDNYADEVAEKSGLSACGTGESDEEVKQESETTLNDEGEEELADTSSTLKEKKLNKPRNAAWQAMLKKDAEKFKKSKRGHSLIEAEAEEEEEEEVAGLEDFGFKVHKKKDDDDEEGVDDTLDEEDLKHVVDDLSDDEGDEDAGDAARKRLEQKEEKERHKDIMRRLREGYDGRRGGIAGGGTGARGMHRFDQLVAADNREDAKRLGLLNDDELDSDNEGKGDTQLPDDEEDEAALLDKMLKDRFLHRSSVDLEENFSDDEEEEDETQQGKD
jgi:hypothetical protein